MSWTSYPLWISKQTFSRTLVRFGGAAALAAGLALAAPQEEALARGAPESFADLAENLSPAVVNISTTQKVERQSNGNVPMPDLPEGSPFEDFFKDFFDERMQRGPRKVMSLGSGFVIDADGIVITNNHVIAQADEITVKFVDGTELEATVLGRDAKTDLAVLQVKPEKPLPFVSFGDSDAMRVGDWVVAIGNPFGLGGTVTAGIVSARNRNINAGPYDDFLQTDASINRGNSGGPLFNMAGEVVGVNTAIISPSGGSIGIGFSIPATIAKNIVGQLREFGETRRGWLGVRIQAVSPEIAESMDLDEPKGALVAGVEDEGPAQAAGIQVGDLILKFDGKDVPEMRDLPRIVAETEIDKSVKVEILRKGKTKTLDVNIARLDEKEDVAEAESTEEGPHSESPSLGLTLSAITQDLRKEYDIAEDVSGVVVVAVDFESDAADKVRKGDVIIEVSQEPVATPQEVIDRVDELLADSNKPILLLLDRRGERTFRSVRPKKS